MRTRHLTALATLAAAALLAACSSTPEANDPMPTASAPELTDEQRASIREAAGLPPTPNPTDWAAYIKALDAVDPDIVHGKEEKAISRGIDTCSGIKRYPGDTAKQAKTAAQRFTSPDHPEGRDTTTGEKILNAAHKHICPTY